ncbi:MAG: S9 family peptidase [Deltaproteobacteria bacterium]|nr:S9 family peptidase [Deltaproteobacteria bacterium]
MSYFLKPQTELIPREVLFGNPVHTSPQISPDGKALAYLAPHDNVLNVWVRELDGKKEARVVTKDRERGIRRYFWGQDGKHILYLQDFGGDENWHLFGVNLETNEIRDFTPFNKVQVQVIEHNKHFPNDILLGINKDNPNVHDVYRLSLATGELTLVVKNPGNVVSWLVDADFKVRGAVSSALDGGFDLFVRDDEFSEWKRGVTWSAEDAMASTPAAFTRDGKGIYLKDSRGANTARLVRLDLGTGETQVLAEDPQYDVHEVLIHPDTYEVQAVAFQRERLEYQILDRSISEDFASIQKFHRGDFTIASRDNEDVTWIVYFEVDTGPASYYLYDRKSKEAAFLFDHMPDLNHYTLAPMEPIKFTSRDGLTIHGYLTFPAASNRKGLPLVLNVHGGPWARDSWGFNPTAQWFANRGYACLEVNFRGSIGYGKSFINAGDKEWGGKMQDDMVDAVRWAVDQGYADPQKIAIYGGSYGGYAALVGATFTPDLFRCAIDIVGPSHLVSFIRSIPSYWSSYLAMFHKRVGNPDTEEEFLKSRSPLFKVDQIKIPLLIAQGANDPRVKQAESEQIVEALKAKGIPHEYIVFPDEGHGFAKPQNRLKFYEAAEKFLAKCLDGRYQEGK